MINQYVYKVYISVGICIEIAKKYTYQPEYIYKVYISIPTDIKLPKKYIVRYLFW